MRRRQRAKLLLITRRFFSQSPPTHEPWLRIGAKLSAAEKRDGAIPVNTPESPGQVTL